MGKPSKAVLDFMEKYGVEASEIWEVHGSTWVVKHKALERVAVEQGIVWLRPSVQVCDLAAKIAVICAFGKIGEREEWSFGEASPANNKNSYPMAMAEKRARDRVILKLLVTHGALYSEAEADEFTQPRQNPHVTRPQDVFDPIERDEQGHPIDNIQYVEPGKKLTVAEQRPIFSALQTEIHATGSSKAARAFVESNEFLGRFALMKPDWQEILRGVYADHLKSLQLQEQGDDMRMAG